IQQGSAARAAQGVFGSHARGEIVPGDAADPRKRRGQTARAAGGDENPGANEEEKRKEEKGPAKGTGTAGANSRADDGGGRGVWMDGQRRGDASQDVRGEKTGFDRRWRKLDRSAGATALSGLDSNSGLSTSAGAFVCRRAAGLREGRRGCVEIVRGDAAGSVGRARAAGDRHAQVAMGPNAHRRLNGEGCVPRRGTGDAIHGTKPRENGLPALPANGIAGEQFAGGVAGQADQPPGEGNRTVLE